MKYFMVMPLMAFFVVSGCSEDPDASANRLYSEASNRFSEYENVDTYSEQWEIYRETDQRIETILKKYPESDVAASLHGGQYKIGDVNLSKFRALEKDLPQLAKAESDPVVALSVYTKQAVVNEEDWAQFWVAHYLSMNGFPEQALELASDFSEESIRANAYVDAASFFYNEDDVKSYEKLLEKAKDINDGSGLSDNDINMTVMALTGRLEEAIKYYESKDDPRVRSAEYLSKFLIKDNKKSMFERFYTEHVREKTSGSKIDDRVMFLMALSRLTKDEDILSFLSDCLENYEGMIDYSDPFQVSVLNAAYVTFDFKGNEKNRLENGADGQAGEVTDSSISELARAYALSGQFAKSEKYVEKAKQSGDLLFSAPLTLSREYAREGRTKDALRIAEGATSEMEKAAILGAVANLHRKNEREELTGKAAERLASLIHELYPIHAEG